MKNYFFLILFLLLSLFLFNSCTIFNPIPSEYPPLSGDDEAHVTYKVTFLSSSNVIDYDYTDIYGFAPYSGYYLLDVDDGDGSYIVIEVSGLDEGIYGTENYQFNTLEYGYGSDTYYYDNSDSQCTFSITIAGKQGVYIWGNFSGKLKVDSTNYVEITNGKFSAVNP